MSHFTEEVIKKFVVRFFVEMLSWVTSLWEHNIFMNWDISIEDLAVAVNALCKEWV